MARGYEKPECRPTKVPTDIDIAWAAGIWEGEGSVSGKGYSYAVSRISVSQKDTEILYRLRELFGGGVSHNYAKIKRRPDEMIFRWNVCGERGRIFAAVIYKFLSTRRKVQIDSTRILDFLEGKNPDGLSMSELHAIAVEFTEKSLKKTPRAISSRAYVRRKILARVLPEGAPAPMERVM